MEKRTWLIIPSSRREEFELAVNACGGVSLYQLTDALAKGQLIASITYKEEMSLFVLGMQYEANITKKSEVSKEGGRV